MVQKLVNVKAKIGLKSDIIARNMDFYCFKYHCLSQNIFAKVQTQGLITKKSKLEKSNLKDLKLVNEKILAPFYTNKPEMIFCQDKKKKYFKKKRNQKNSILAKKDYTIENKKK